MIDILPISFLTGIFLIFLEKIRNKYGVFNLRNTVQTLHKKSVSRFGGLGIFISLAIVSFFSSYEDYAFLRKVLLCTCPIFILGMLDDLDFKISAFLRLIFVFPSAFVTYYFLGIEAYSLEIPLIDNLFDYRFFSILFICFALGGIVNAFNLIDGVNGLVLVFSLCVCVSVIGSGYVFKSAELTLYFVALLFSIFGILLLNFPLGRIFIGDGGAYFLGAAVSIGLIKIYQINELSPWYVLVMLIYPVTDVCASLLRRIALKKSALEPDNKHLHHMILNRVKKMGISSDNTQHFIVTLLMLLLYLPFLLGANYFAENTIILILLAGIYISFYLLLYVLLNPKNFRKRYE